MPEDAREHGESFERCEDGNGQSPGQEAKGSRRGSRLFLGTLPGDPEECRSQKLGEEATEQPREAQDEGNAEEENDPLPGADVEDADLPPGIRHHPLDVQEAQLAVQGGHVGERGDLAFPSELAHPDLATGNVGDFIDPTGRAGGMALLVTCNLLENLVGYGLDEPKPEEWSRTATRDDVRLTRDNLANEIGGAE